MKNTGRKVGRRNGRKREGVEKKVWKRRNEWMDETEKEIDRGMEGRRGKEKKRKRRKGRN